MGESATKALLYSSLAEVRDAAWASKPQYVFIFFWHRQGTSGEVAWEINDKIAPLFQALHGDRSGPEFVRLHTLEKRLGQMVIRNAFEEGNRRLLEPMHSSVSVTAGQVLQPNQQIPTVLQRFTVGSWEQIILSLFSGQKLQCSFVGLIVDWSHFETFTGESRGFATLSTEE